MLNLPRFKTFVFGMLVFLTLGIAILWISQRRTVVTINNLQNRTIATALSKSVKAKQSVNISEITPANSSEEKITLLEASISGLLTRVSNLEDVKEISTTTSPITFSAPAFQAQTLFLGSASTTKNEWTNTGVESLISSYYYPDDVSAVFEAGLSIAGGEAWARLVNKTTGAIINITEVMNNQNSLVWKSSPAFKLHFGNNTYEVQLKSSSGETVNLSGARLRIYR